MANHCINKVRVVGIKGEALEKIMNIFKSDGFEYDKPFYRESDDNTGWAFDCVRSKPNEVYFCTRWCPPLYFIQLLSERHPEASFDIMFSEPGFEVFGHEKFKAGFGYWDDNNLYDSSEIRTSFDKRLFRGYNKYLADAYNGKEVEK